MTDGTGSSPNTRGLLAHAQQKAQEVQQRVHQTIDRLLREQQIINFNTVAKAVQVTKSYLYAHQEVRERIEALRTKQCQDRLSQHRATEKLRPDRTDQAKEVLLAAKEKRIKALKTENRKLKEELKVLYGKLYEQV